MVKTTKKDFKLFKRECRKWINFFGLKQWEVLYFHEPCENDSRAKYYTNISSIAFHEVVEGMLFANITFMLTARGYSKSEIDEVIHPIIRTLENTVFK